MIRIAICDDESQFVDQIHGILLSREKQLPVPIHISTYTDSGQLLYDLEEKVPFDLLFLDIEMPEINGMSLAAVIRRQLPVSLIVFITSHTQYAVKAFELSVFRYIPKSEIETCLPLALQDACRLLIQNCSVCYLIESSRRLIKISVNDIFYIYKNQKYAVIVTENEEYPVRKTLDQVLKELCQENENQSFQMAERGYIVNLFHVKRMEENEVVLDHGFVIPVSRRHARELRSAMVEYWGSRI